MSDIAVKVSEPVALKARLNEDWLAVAIGLFVFALALFSVSGIDLLGWVVTTSVYTNLGNALAPVAKGYAALGGGASLLLTYAALLLVLSIGVSTLGAGVKKFALAFTAVFAIAYASWIAGSFAYIAAVTPAEQQKFGKAAGIVGAVVLDPTACNGLPQMVRQLARGGDHAAEPGVAAGVGNLQGMEHRRERRDVQIAHVGVPHRFTRTERSDRGAGRIEHVGNDIDVGIAGRAEPAVLLIGRRIQIAEAATEIEQIVVADLLVAEQKSAMFGESRVDRTLRRRGNVAEIDGQNLGANHGGELSSGDHQ